MPPYTDLDESFPVPELTPADPSLDRHWTLLPSAVWAARLRQLCEAQAQARRQALPENHQLILVPADPTYSPTEVELWPLVTQAVHDCLLRHPEVHQEVIHALESLTLQYQGWRNPYRQT